MRHVADHGHRLVVVLARQRDDARADGGDQLVQAREVLGGPSMPFTSEPAMGCPGTKFSGCGRTRSAKAVMRAFVEAVSVTMPR